MNLRKISGLPDPLRAWQIYLYESCPFIFCVRMHWHLRALLTLDRLPLPRVANSWSAWLICKCTFPMQTNRPKPHTPPPPCGAFSLWAPVPCRHHTRPDTRQRGTASVLQSLLKLFKLVNPKPIWPAHPPLPIPSHENHSKPLAHVRSLLLLTGPA